MAWLYGADPHKISATERGWAVEDSALIGCVTGLGLRIPMMPISHSDLMPIRTERSDAGLSQCEIVIGIRQEFRVFSLS
jgi:hypothetical protein